MVESLAVKCPQCGSEGPFYPKKHIQDMKEFEKWVKDLPKGKK